MYHLRLLEVACLLAPIILPCSILYRFISHLYLFFSVLPRKAMEFLTSILGLVPCLYDHTSEHTVYIRDLSKNLQALSKEMVYLNNLLEDVKARVERAEQRQMMRTKEVGGWICAVEDMKKEAAQILQRGNQEIQRRCLGCCPRNCWSSYRIGKDINEKLVAVSRQIEKGHFEVVAEMLPRPVVDELPLEEMVGAELAYDQICRFLEDPQVGVVGLYGIGGVGKTTLLKKVNNGFPAVSNGFDSVIWVVVSMNDMEIIQKDIWNQLQFPVEVWETKASQESKAAEILGVLKRKKFILLLDDIWERLDLLQMGVPHPNAENKSKIIFTTRSQDVCRQMKAQKSIQVACLEAEAAWTLFRKEVGEETLNSHPHISRLAQAVAQGCNGLPLALITVGRAMTGEKDPSIWEGVVRDISKFPTEISGMETELFHRLKLSYDRLPNDASRSCFLYHCMFRRGWEVYNYELIEQWIGAGFLGEVLDDMHQAREQGRKIIRTLNRACLLENCGSKERRVKMHDVLRDLALWLYAECGLKQHKVLIFNGVLGLKNDLETSELKETENISFWNIKVEDFPITLMCPNLKILILKLCNGLEKFSSGFFQFMPLLRVLDLSNNVNLSELPVGIGQLDALRYLNLSYTRIRELPVEVKHLKSLMILLMDGMDSLENIPQDFISSLKSLKFFSLYNLSIIHGIEENLLEELESLNSISGLRINVSCSLVLNKLRSSHKLLRCISHVQFYQWCDVIFLELSSSFFERAEHLNGLAISYCDELKGLKVNLGREGMENEMSLTNEILAREKCFHNLRNVVIRHCKKLLDLTWLLYVPCLEFLYVESCESLEEVLQGCGVNENEEKLDIFSRLKYVKLNELPRLKSIYHHPLPFPSLEVVKVFECKSLRSLPFDSNTSIINLRKIKGETSWWNGLEWNEETTKQIFIPYFKNHEVSRA